MCNIWYDVWYVNEVLYFNVQTWCSGLKNKKTHDIPRFPMTFFIKIPWHFFHFSLWNLEFISLMVAEIAEDQILWAFLSLIKVIQLNFQRKQLVVLHKLLFVFSLCSDTWIMNFTIMIMCLNYLNGQYL